MCYTGGLEITGRVKRFTKTNLHVRKERAGVIRQVVVFDGIFSAQRSVKVCVQIEQGLALRWPAAHVSKGPSKAQPHAKEETRTSEYRDDVLVDQLCMTPEDLVVADVAIDTVSERACVCDGASRVETETHSPVNLQEVLDEVSAIDVGLGPPRPMNRKLSLLEPRVRPPDLGLFTALARAWDHGELQMMPARRGVLLPTSPRYLVKRKPPNEKPSRRHTRRAFGFERSFWASRAGGGRDAHPGQTAAHQGN